MREELGYWVRRSACIARKREAVAAFSIFVLLFNILTGILSHHHYGGQDGLGLTLDGGKMAICSGSKMVFIDKDGRAVPVPPQQQHNDCACCLLMQASAVMPPPPSAPPPPELAAIQILRPNDVAQLDAARVHARGNRDPPYQV
jgi:hypothetical protein